MPKATLTANGEWASSVPGRTDGGFRLLSYTGWLGGGTLQVFSVSSSGVKTPVADSKLNASKVDGNGDVIQQMTFQTAGMIVVALTGATDPNVVVSVE